MRIITFKFHQFSMSAYKPHHLACNIFRLIYSDISLVLNLLYISIYHPMNEAQSNLKRRRRKFWWINVKIVKSWLICNFEPMRCVVDYNDYVQLMVRYCKNLLSVLSLLCQWLRVTKKSAQGNEYEYLIFKKYEALFPS